MARKVYAKDVKVGDKIGFGPLNSTDTPGRLSDADVDGFAWHTVYEVFPQPETPYVHIKLGARTILRDAWDINVVDRKD